MGLMNSVHKLFVQDSENEFLPYMKVCSLYVVLPTEVSPQWHI